ncbi:MAG: outer membrane beta-barrel protein [Planctomycetota bacterium]
MLRVFARIALPLSLAACAATAPQSAQDSDGGNYFGVKGGILNISRDLPYNNGVNLGALFGHDLPGNDISVEVEVSASVDSADSNSEVFGKLDVFTLGGYGVYRSPGALYFKGKAGLIYQYLNVENRAISLEGDGIGLSVGVGGGYRITNGASIELEYTVIERDIDLATLGVNFAL